MNTTVEELERWMSLPSETEHVEFKEAKTQYDHTKLFRYCVALANEGGGRMILGVTDKRPRRVVGSQAFLNIEGIKAKLLDTLKIRVEVEVVEHPQGRVLVFHVPSRPIGTPLHLDGQYLMRAGEQLVAMTADKLRRIFDEGKADFLSRTAAAGLSADDIVRLLDTQGYFDLIKLPYPVERGAVLERFAGERLISPREGLYDITNLGALLFAKNLDDFDGLARKAPRVIVYAGKGKLSTRSDQFVSKGYAVGFETLIRYVNAHLPSNEVIGRALRETIRMYPEIAVRELIANALIHQDFEETGTSVVIELYSDRLEIANPGQPSIRTERFIDGYRSRNEMLADLMRRLRICEEKGSGIDKVIDSVEQFQLPAPDFRVSETHTTVVLFAQKPFDEMDRNDKVRACYQHCCLKYVSGEKMTNQSLRERFKLGGAKADQVSRIIREAVNAGQIKPDDPESASKRYSKYVPFWA
ncbi:MAG: putative DNA binding domain-containing protein [Acidobacteria bacterium]|nr:putative DNA binding domain-containing protein [Acidobacteriota bacterium]